MNIKKAPVALAHHGRDERKLTTSILYHIKEDAVNV